MDALCRLILFLMLCSFSSLNLAQDYDDPEGLDPRNSRFHENERSCQFRRQQGFCRRRSECNRPTRQVCRFGLNPIVCCLDQHEPKPATIFTTRRPPVTTEKFIMKPDSVREIDLTYPGCGFRSPKIQGTGSSNSNSRGRGGLFSRRGKRSTSEKFSFNIREKRAVLSVPVIVGGVTAIENSWPWMVAVFKEVNARSPKRFVCGASLISQKYVLTAAHCFDSERGNVDPSKFFIVVGAHTTKDGTEYPVRQILIHPDYKQRQYYNDITLITVARPVELSKKVYPVCVPSDGLRDKIQTGNSNVTVTGWGDTSFGGVSSMNLQELTIPIVPLKECNASYAKLSLSSFPQGITKLFICAGVQEGGKDACQGDSGGPLVSKLKDNSYVQLGVVSFGYGCAQAGYPGVYTRVSQYTKWIYENTDLGK